ncbi:hypothetical protein SR39_10455 [Methylobacterium radiotolerans]|nr:hypothetical protein SR39_10455 [Methylobacterium radiotolerans]
MLVDDQEADLAQGRGGGPDLLDLVEAVPVGLDHSPQAPDLTLDPPQPPDQRRALRVGPGEADTTIDERAACHGSASHLFPSARVAARRGAAPSDGAVPAGGPAGCPAAQPIC